MVFAVLLLLNTADPVQCQVKGKGSPPKSPPPPPTTPPVKSSVPPSTPPAKSSASASTPPAPASPVTPVGSSSKPPKSPGSAPPTPTGRNTIQKGGLPKSVKGPPPPPKGDPSMGFLQGGRRRKRRILDDYWSMASQVANAMNPLSMASTPAATTRSQIVTELFDNPVYASLFQNMPNLLKELDELSSEQLKDSLVLFKMYTKLPQSVTPFFHQAIADMSSVAPTLPDLTKFSIATQLTLFVHSIIEPDSKIFADLPSYSTAPSVGAIASFVGRVLLENLGQPLPIMVFNILREVLTLLIKAYLDGQLPHLPKLPIPKLPNIHDVVKVPSDAINNLKQQLPSVNEVVKVPSDAINNLKQQLPSVNEVVKVPSDAINNIRHQIPKVIPKVPKIPRRIKPKIRIG